MSPTSASQA
uniref:Uncharacterized protein n=1 Tax=Rhizophora mucronata TaxID=61149 RepID=A0A2P2P115_RHIMU